MSVWESGRLPTLSQPREQRRASSLLARLSKSGRRQVRRGAAALFSYKGSSMCGWRGVSAQALPGLSQAWPTACPERTSGESGRTQSTPTLPSSGRLENDVDPWGEGLTGQALILPHPPIFKEKPEIWISFSNAPLASVINAHSNEKMCSQRSAQLSDVCEALSG